MNNIKTRISFGEYQWKELPSDFRTPSEIDIARNAWNAALDAVVTPSVEELIAALSNHVKLVDGRGTLAIPEASLREVATALAGQIVVQESTLPTADGLTRDSLFRTLQKFPGMAQDIMATVIWSDVEKLIAATEARVRAEIAIESGKLFDDLRALPQVEGEGWIAVTERLPEVGKMVLVTQVGIGGHGVKEYESRLWKAVLMDNGEFWTSDTMLPSRVWGVVNWQPLPAAPKPLNGGTE